MVLVQDIALLSLSSFMGNVGVALTGFGMAIVYLFVWQIAVLCGYNSDFKFAVFIQALALFSAQPLLLWKAEIREHASRRMLMYFIPITIISTPLGQAVGDRVSTSLVEVIGGVLVTFVAVFEMYQKRELFAKWIFGCFRGSKKANKSLATKKFEHWKMDPLSTESLTDGTAYLELYHIGKKLGEGSFSIVKEGICKRSGKSFAIKIITKSQLQEGEEEKLQGEISLMRQLSHPNILSLHKVFEEPEYYFLVTGKMSGGDLLSRLSNVSFFNEHQGRQMCQVFLDAIAYMHTKKIAHRDLKPENILLDSDKEDAHLKLADFGFARREDTPNCFKTMCGTPSYVACEVLKRLPYGIHADMWSIGVIVYSLLAGYQPFRGDNDDALKTAIMIGSFEFDRQFWKDISSEASDLISSMLTVDPTQRITAEAALQHPWFKKDIGAKQASEEDDTPVFFMVGSQRSGSNWLRTMIDEREDIAGPHPPHVMRDFMPILGKFGDLSNADNFKVLVDHVCRFVERNQVPWTNKHGIPIKFPRVNIFNAAYNSCERFLSAHQSSGDNQPLEGTIYLLSVFDAIMNFYVKANGKRVWMCKSMGMSKFHDTLLDFYGEKRLRYIYLVRDPRDVAMSFMKTPVGDCHYHAIITKWTSLQEHSLRIVEEYPQLVHKVHYESILRDKQNVVKGIYDFIGDRRFGGVRRQASVMIMNTTEDLIQGANKGREALKAQTLSYQFKNLVRTESFAKNQHAKWRHPKNGLNEEELQLLESVAHRTMQRLGYEPHIVGASALPTDFTNEDLKDFGRLNKAAINKMNQDLKEENPGDFERRIHQTEALSFLPTLEKEWDESEGTDGDDNAQAFLTEEQLATRVEVSAEKAAFLPNGRRFRFSAASQRGYYPHEHDRPNQDASRYDVATNGGSHWFSVLDGHGPAGHECSGFSAQRIPQLFRESIAQGLTIKQAMEKSHETTHKQLTGNPDIESELSGTTATTLLLEGNKFIVANVGDSTCILGSKDSAGLSAKLLCSEHTPLRKDERARILKAGGVVMTADQRDRSASRHDNRDASEAPPRIWSRDGAFPGCAFSRSIGDSIAHSLGVSARPEVFIYNIKKENHVVIVASDGITEFMDQQTCVEIACRHNSPAEAARALVQESSKRWIRRGDYIDDITAIVIFLDANEKTWDVEAASPESLETVALGFTAQFWTLFAGFASGFLGGLCGIRGPPIIIYFLHPPYPVSFDKKTQRATGASITATNVAMRIAYYLVNTLAFDGEDFFEASDWSLYVYVVIFSLAGVLVGSKVFEYMKDSKATIRGILSIFLLLCGVSLLISSFADV